MIRIHSRVRRGDVYGVVVDNNATVALVAWMDGSESYAYLDDLTLAPFVVTLDEALAFVARVKATGAHSVAVPVDVLDALVAGCRADSR